LAAAEAANASLAASVAEVTTKLQNAGKKSIGSSHDGHMSRHPHAWGFTEGHKLKLTYFPIRGLADAARVMLHDNGVEFTDEQVAGVCWVPFVDFFARV
jgi:hypothetical protein